MKILDPYAPGASRGHETYEFECSGNKLRANCYIIGIDPELAIHEGYDGHLSGPHYSLRPDEQRELADFMIDLWGKYKASIK